MKRVPLLLLTLALAGCSSAQISTDYDRGTDFSGYKTYAWIQGAAAANPMVEDRLRAAIDKQLAAEGLRKVADSPDLQVATYASVSENQQVNIDSYGYGYWGGWPGNTSVNVSSVDVGTLLVDLVDTSTQKLVWRGVATATGHTVSEAMANKVAAKMFARYPPKP